MTQTNRETCPVISYDLVAFSLQCQKLIQQGWCIDPKHPPSTYGRSYECQMFRTKETVAAQRSYYVVGDGKRPDNSEALKVARAQKAANNFMGRPTIEEKDEG